MKKIGIGNKDLLENNNLKVSRKSKSGLVATLCLAITFGSLYGVYLDDLQEVTKPSETITHEKIEFNLPSIDANEFIWENSDSSQKEPISVSLADINNLNIIINDADCMHDFVNSVCQELETAGIKFTYTSDCRNIDSDGAVVITLDQQYMAGPGTTVFAPLENGRIGNSDALALAAEKSFYEKGFIVDGIACGKMGFRENEDGTISERVPTATEDAMGDFTDASYITISFGTGDTPAGLVAEAIQSTLIRYCSYINSNYDNQDLIYCVEDGQDYDDVANVLGTTTNMIDFYNDTADESLLLPGETIVNPVVGEIKEFDQNVSTSISANKELWSK